MQLFGYTNLSERLFQFKQLFDVFAEDEDEALRLMMNSNKLRKIIMIGIGEAPDDRYPVEANTAKIILGDFFTALFLEQDEITKRSVTDENKAE